MISTVHTFGRDLNWNPHLHIILSEGASGHFTIWRSHILFAFNIDPLKCNCGHTLELINIFFRKNSPILDSNPPPPYNFP